MDRDTPLQEGGTEGHSTLDIFLVSLQAIHKKEYLPALGFSEAMKPWGSSLLFIETVWIGCAPFIWEMTSDDMLWSELAGLTVTHPTLC